MYIWLAGAYLCASLFCFHWVMPNVLENYSLWTRIWNLSIPVFIWSLLSFLMIWFDLPIKTLRKTLGLALIPITLAVLLAPSTYLILVLGISQFTSLVLGLICLSLIVESRSKQSKLNFYMVFGLLSLALTFAISEWIYNRLHPEWFLVQFGHLIPLALFLLLLWIIMSQLSNSLQKFEALTETQQSEIQAKTQELEQSYQQLSERSSQLAIDEERHRIMLELHDGVGGQLVNALAYMSNAGNNDPVLKSALEDSLRDMGLMIDSLDITDDVSTLLGMLRGRIEPLLNNHQMTLRWQIDEDPLLGATSPSTNLNLLRIVQEAITNSVKHSGASTVTVTAMRNSVSVLDDGCGFDPTTQRAHPDQHKGMGLRSMKKRAADMNLDLNITASPSGTRVVLSWD
jgi:signal transduction histidine kinase